MSTGSIIALVIIAIVVAAGIYLATRPTPGSMGNGAGYGFGGALPPAQPEGAAYITAGGGAVGAILNGVGGILGRQAGGSGSGGSK